MENGIYTILMIVLTAFTGLRMWYDTEKCLSFASCANREERVLIHECVVVRQRTTGYILSLGVAGLHFMLGEVQMPGPLVMIMFIMLIIAINRLSGKLAGQLLQLFPIDHVPVSIKT